VPDGVQQVGLAQSRLAIDEEGVVRLGRRLGHRDRRRVGEPVAGPDHEGVEGVLGIEPGGRLVTRRGRVVAGTALPRDVVCRPGRGCAGHR
jgi:hypothetical protein